MGRHSTSRHARSPYITTMQDNPLWEADAHGTISLKSNPNCRMRQSAGKWESVSIKGYQNLVNPPGTDAPVAETATV